MLRNINVPYILFCASIYALSATVLYQNAYEDRKRQIRNNETTLLLIAHPDDESMFFGPTIIRKLDKYEDENGNELENSDNFFLLCVTQGNQNGLGHLRKHELMSSAIKLGIKSSNVKILDDARWLDGDNQNWHKASLQELIIDFILSRNVTELITFDDYGVSGHLNHQTIFKIARSIKYKLNFIKFKTLQSINRIQKYLAFFDFSFFYFTLYKQSDCIYLVNLNEFLRLIDAFYSHQTQLVWFRRLYAFFSKYMYVNVLQEFEF